jgi:hypothetical protein
MPGRKPLKGGARRLLNTHSGKQGFTFRRCYDALAEQLGPFTRLQALEASRVAVAWVNFEAASRALALARHARTNGRGRRPNAQAIERLARRQGLADTSYAAALAALRDLVGTPRPPAPIADLVARQQRGRA